MDDLQRHSEIITVYDDSNNERVEKKQIVGTSLGVGIIYLDRYPVRFYGIEIKIGDKILQQVESTEEINSNSYFVDWDNGFVQFDFTNLGQSVIVKYFGNTYTRISANRVYTVLDEQGQVTETIDSFIEGQRTKVDDKITEFTITENARKSNENTRITQENTRKTNEATRQSQETTRESNEGIRKSNEVIRETNESTRKANEIVREDNESKRKIGYSKMDTRIDNLVLGQGSQTEAIDARLDSITNKLHPTLKARLDDTSNQLTQNSLATLTTSTPVASLENATDGIMQIDSIKGRTLQNLWKDDNPVTYIKDGYFHKNNLSFNLFEEGEITLFNPNPFQIQYNLTSSAGNSVLVIIAGGKRKQTLILGDKITTLIGKIENGWTLDNKDNLKGFILKGDYSDKDLQYFDGIKSVGELEGNKIEVLSRGRNELIYNPDTWGEWTKSSGSIADKTGLEFISDGKTYKTARINTNLKSSTKYGVLIKVVNFSNKSIYIDNSGATSTSVAFEEGAGSKKSVFTTKPVIENNNLVFVFASPLATAGQSVKGKDIKVYELPTNSQIESDFRTMSANELFSKYNNNPFQQYDKTEILLKEPLMGLPNGAKDEIDVMNRKLSTRIKKEILQPEGFIEYISSPSPLYFRAHIRGMDSAKIQSNCVCNNFVNEQSIWGKEKEGIAFHTTLPILYINILKTKLTTPDLAGFKKWLSENPTEIYYELAEPVITTINPSSLKSFKDGSIVLNNAISPTISLKYPTSISGRLSSVESTLDGTVDRTKKLEEGLFTTVGQVIDNKDKIEVLNNSMSDNKIDSDKVKTEVENARNGKANLKAEIDGIKGNVSSLGVDNITNKNRLTKLESKNPLSVTTLTASDTISTDKDVYAKSTVNGLSVNTRNGYVTSEAATLWFTDPTFNTLRDINVKTAIHHGAKTALVDTKSYGKTFMYVEESPTPTFGDYGSGVIGTDGLCYVYLDPQFVETISTNHCDYWLQLTGWTGCNAEINGKEADYFVVSGNPNKKFEWKAIGERKGYERMRFNEAMEANNIIGGM